MMPKAVTLPTMEALEDEVVFLSLQTANRLGFNPAAVVQVYEGNAAFSKSTGKRKSR